MTSFDVPKQQLAAVRVGEGENAKAPVQKIDVVLPGPNEALIMIRQVCGFDGALTTDVWAGNGVKIQPEAKDIARREGPGVIVAVGDNMHHKWEIGDRANPSHF